MNNAFIVHGDLINPRTIRLKEPVNINNPNIRVIIEEIDEMNNKTVDIKKLVLRKVAPFLPFTREEMHER